MEAENSRKRRRYGAELKVQILAECDRPGASVAKVAMAHGINANIVHGWRKLAREAGAGTVSDQFVPVVVAADTATNAPSLSSLRHWNSGLAATPSWRATSDIDMPGSYVRRTSAAFSWTDHRLRR